MNPPPPQSQVGVADALPLPRLPKIYLEAGSALLAAKRPADALALCDEVINTTLDLLPNKRLNLEEEELGDGAEAGSGALDRLETVLWAGSAHLLQAHCQAHLKDWKQAVELYTRSEGLEDWSSVAGIFLCLSLCMEPMCTSLLSVCVFRFRCINLVVKVCVLQKGEFWWYLRDDTLLCVCVCCCTDTA